MVAGTFDASRKTNAASTSASAAGIRNPASFPEPSVAPWPPWSGGLDTAPEATGAAYGFHRRAARRASTGGRSGVRRTGPYRVHGYGWLFIGCRAPLVRWPGRRPTQGARSTRRPYPCVVQILRGKAAFCADGGMRPPLFGRSATVPRRKRYGADALLLDAWKQCAIAHSSREMGDDELGLCA